jgi:hypothetical protein
MDLREFVEKSITDIVTAVENVRGKLVRDVELLMTANSRTIEFDIAVTAEKVDGVKGEANITVLGMAGTRGHVENQNKNSRVSRIQFGVMVNALSQKQIEDHNARARTWLEEDRNEYSAI